MSISGITDGSLDNAVVGARGGWHLNTLANEKLDRRCINPGIPNLTNTPAHSILKRVPKAISVLLFSVGISIFRNLPMPSERLLNWADIVYLKAGVAISL